MTRVAASVKAIGRRAAAFALLLASSAAQGQSGYWGFDKNGYPGDDLLPALHRTFAFTGFWLNNPPGMQANPWAGKRAVVRAAGFGFVILFNGRVDDDIRKNDAAALGRSDGADAAAAARREGFPAGAVIYLDEEEGGGLLPEQAAYIGAWIAAVRSGGFDAGVYCSGIEVAAGSKRISTAEDVRARFPGAKLWVWNDASPPSPGCVTAGKAGDPASSGISDALVWQYARSPRGEKGTAAYRATFAADDGCYAPGMPESPATWLDLDVGRSPDPSRGR